MTPSWRHHKRVKVILMTPPRRQIVFCLVAVPGNRRKTPARPARGRFGGGTWLTRHVKWLGPLLQSLRPTAYGRRHRSSSRHGPFTDGSRRRRVTSGRTRRLQPATVARQGDINRVIPAELREGGPRTTKPRRLIRRSPAIRRRRVRAAGRGAEQPCGPAVPGRVSDPASPSSASVSLPRPCPKVISSRSADPKNRPTPWTGDVHLAIAVPLNEALPLPRRSSAG